MNKAKDVICPTCVRPIAAEYRVFPPEEGTVTYYCPNCHRKVTPRQCTDPGCFTCDVCRSAPLAIKGEEQEESLPKQDVLGEVGAVGLRTSNSGSLWHAAATYHMYEQMRKGRTVSESHVDGTLPSSVEDFLERLKEYGFSARHKEFNDKQDLTSAFCSLDGGGAWCSLYDTGNGHYRLLWQATDEKTKDYLLETHKLFDSGVIQDTLYLITRGTNGYQIAYASQGVGQELIRNNYGEATLKSYDAAVKDMGRSQPHGRLVLIDGPTGSGKTWMIRGIMHECPQAHFVMLPSTMVGALNSPEFMPMLVRERSERGLDDGPLVFIIEDGDSCLVPRGADNMSEVQALLNAADGLLSHSYDMRAIITTNAGYLRGRKEQIDEALTRPGRLSTKIRVPELPQKHAEAVLKRLLSTAEWNFSSPTSLARVYRIALDQGWEPPVYNKERAYSGPRLIVEKAAF